eukprot:2472141-Prymnesium_polylepis.1
MHARVGSDGKHPNAYDLAPHENTAVERSGLRLLALLQQYIGQQTHRCERVLMHLSEARLGVALIEGAPEQLGGLH